MPGRTKAPVSTEDAIAKHGEKMICLEIYLWTNAISSKKGQILKKHAWDDGVVRIRTNESHGIKSTREKHFDGIYALSGTVADLLKDAGIKLHRGTKTRKLYAK